MEESKFKYDSSKINLRSEEITELLGIPPRWIIRWGISIFFITIALIFIGSAFFKYPDIVLANANITSDNPPSIVISKASGKITDIMFVEGSHVNKGDTIAVIENPTKLNDIKITKSIIQGFNPQNGTSETVENFLNHKNLNLGEVQMQFNLFSKAYFDYQLFLQQNYHEQKVKALELENTRNYQYYSQLLSQQKLAFNDLELTRKQYVRDSQLYISQVIPSIEYEKSQAILLSKQQLLESAQLNLTTTIITIERLKQSIKDLNYEHANQNNSLREDLVNSYNLLISSLSTWEKNYLLIAPSSGKLTYMNVRSNLQEIKSGDRLFTIDPEIRGDIFAMLIIPFEGIGKIRIGEQVNIKLDGYPYMEFGIIEGTIQSISSGSTEKGFPATVRLKKGALTSYGHAINFERDLSGVAEITTDDLTLLQRLFSPLRYIYKNKLQKK